MSIDEHTHTNILKGGRLRRGHPTSSTTSLSGTVTGGAFAFPHADIALTPNVFFMMIHTGAPQLHLAAHTTDGGNADNPRAGFSWVDLNGGTTYDLDYRSWSD